MGDLVNKVVSVGTLGLVDDVTGLEAGQDAALRAADIQAQAAMAGTEEVARQFDVTQETLRPTIEAGDLARQQQQALLGLSGTEAQEQATQAISESPAQAFIRKRAQRNLLQNAAAIGGLGGGNVRSALVEQGAGFALQDTENQFARLQGLSAPGTQTAVQQGQIGAQTAGQVAQLTGQAGQAQASGILGAQQVGAQTTQQLFGGATQLGAAALLSDKNKKHDIKDLDLKECFDTVMSMDLKAWRYIESVGLGDDVHYGVMAQDAPECIKIEGKEALSLHDELNLIAGAIQFMKKEGLIVCH